MPARERSESHGGRGVVRGAMLVGWCLVLWGSVVLAATLWALAADGRGAAALHFGRLSPVNQVLAAVAGVVWALVVWGLVVARRSRAPSGG